MKGKAGAFVENDGVITPDTTDQAMAERQPKPAAKKEKKTGGEHVSKE